MNILNKIIKIKKNDDIGEKVSPIKISPDDGASFSCIVELNDIIGKMSDISALSDGLSLIKRDIEAKLVEIKSTKSENMSLSAALTTERQNSDRANTEVFGLKTKLEKIMHAYSIEKRNFESARTKLVDLENKKLELTRMNEDLAATVAKLNGIVSELNISNGTLKNELESALAKRELDEKNEVEMKEKWIVLKDRYEVIANEKENYATQVNILRERVSQQVEEITERENRINKLNEENALLIVKLKRETNVANTLRTENDIFLKEREEVHLKHETEVDVLKKRYRLLEKMLSESRERYRTESSIHVSTKKEKAQLEHELGQYKAQLAAAREEAVELRRRNLELDQSFRTAQNLTSHEADVSKKKTLEIDGLTEEIVNYKSKVRVLESEVAEIKQINIDIDASASMNIETLRKEVHRLREELQQFRGPAIDDFAESESEKRDGGRVLEFVQLKEGS